MKKFLLPLAVTGALFSAQAVTAQEAGEGGEALFKSKPCVACHNVDAQLVGPALKAVAAKYQEEENAVETIAANIKNGSSGQWGAIPMPPNQVTEDEAKLLAEWVMTLE
ncbi:MULTISPECIES: c-type cytochrome [Pseudomonas]|uniref:c-type cytochrome n=1 Tax=Pseudomonas TaxID=286 RepID=UPI001238B20E|nr:MULTISPECIES: c-type cytochrome [Pseudomonas]QIB50277.1 c-type cytochrome [Pseudomonas sp. OIL-1]